ncbi:MAG TPA: XdhC family protein [Chloroflexota bacterium]|nr:XdhC family protein [Chloroflexota bacterium]
MRDLIEQIDRWRAEGNQVAVATVVSAQGSTPRPTGAKMAMTPSGGLAGSVSGGCIEADVFEHAMQVLETGEPKLVRYGFTEDMAFEIGLACGGSVQVFIEKVA